MRPGGLPYAGAVPMPDAFPHTFSADPPYHTQAPKIRLQSRRDQRPAYADLHSNPTYSNSLRRRGGHGHGVASRRGVDVAVRACIQARLKAGSCGPDPWGRLDSTKARRCGAGSAERMTDHAGHRPGPTQKIRRGSRKVRRMPAVTAVVFATFSTLPFPSRVFPFSLFSLCRVYR